MWASNKEKLHEVKKKWIVFIFREISVGFSANSSFQPQIDKRGYQIKILQTMWREDAKILHDFTVKDSAWEYESVK